MRAKPIYSIRTSMGRELWWTTSRKKALEIAEQLDEPGYRVHSNGCVGHSETEGLKAFDLPVAVHRCSVISKGRPEHASREEQHERYLDCGPQAWDDQ